MRIIEVNKYYYNRRGAEGHMFSVIEALEEAGHQVAPFAMHHPKNEETPWSKYFVSHLDTDSLHPLEIPRYILRAFWSKEAYTKMRAMIDAFKPDIIHAHNVYTHLSPSVLKAAKDAGVPVVLTLHDYGLVSGNYAIWSGDYSLYPDHMDFWSIVNSRYIKGSRLATAVLEIISRIHRKMGWYKNNINQFIAVSGAVKEVLVWSGIDEKKVKVLHNFVEVDPLQRSDAPEGFFYYGALEKNKGIEPLLEAAKEIGEKLYIAGNGPMKEEVLTAEADIEYLGFLSKQELVARLSTVRAAVFPSISREVFSTAALEALVAGIPVIVSDAGGYKEMVHEGEFGAVVRAGNANDLAIAMQFIIENQELAEKRAKKAREWILEYEGKEMYMKKLIQIFKEVKRAGVAN